MSKIILSGRVDFPAFFSPAVFPNDDPDRRKYQCVLLIDKEANIDQLKDAMKAAVMEKFNNKVPKGCSWPLQDGDDEDAKPQYAGYWIIKPKTQRPPGVVGPQRERLGADSEIQIRSGDNIRVSVHCYAYDVGGNRGCAIGLDNVQFVSQGESFGGNATSAEDDFEPLPVGPESDVNVDTDGDSDIPF